MIKLLVSDMDGTLLDTKHRISDFNQKAIRKAQENGIKFMIATGRSIQTLTPIINEYDLKCNLLLLNGAEVRDEDRNILSTINIPREKIREISQTLIDMGYIPEYTTNGGAQIVGTEKTVEHSIALRVLCLDRERTLTYEQAVVVGKNGVFAITTSRWDSLDQLLESGLEFRKIIVFGQDEEYNDKCRIKLKEMYPFLSVTSSNPMNLEINYIDAAKGPGLMKAIDILGIKKDEVAVFGDGFNDETMFDLFPNSYAPANAVDEIKKKAKEIIPSNNEDGVGRKILEIINDTKGEGHAI